MCFFSLRKLFSEVVNTLPLSYKQRTSPLLTWMGLWDWKFKLSVGGLPVDVQGAVYLPPAVCVEEW